MPIAEDILRQEELLREAKRTLDLDAIERLYADDLLLTGVLGEPTCRKSAVVEEIARGRAERDALSASGEPFEKTVTNEDINVIALGEAAVATYRFVVRVTGRDVHVHRRFRTTNVWTKRNGDWKIVAAHTAFVLDPQQASVLFADAPARV